MKERPILFSAPMVRAILDGTKTQTRRICKAKKCHDDGDEYRDLDGWPLFDDSPNGTGDIRITSPYGQPGDRLWVRETILMPRAITERDLREGADTWPRCVYSADASWFGRNDPMMSVADAKWECGDLKARGWRGRPSIHMPRWASRITLEVTGVRVERLQDIGAADALTEGITHSTLNDPRVEYRWLWESINGAGSWDANPWVWVIEFNRTTTRPAQGDGNG